MSPVRRARSSRPRSAAAARYTTAPLPAARTPWREAPWCALDFELTGLDPNLDEIISFGAIPIAGGRVQLGGAVSGLVRPERELGVPGIRVHGIRAADLAGAPALSEALEPLVAAIAGRGLVVHTAAVERTFLARGLSALGARLRGPIVDTEVLGQVWMHEHRRRALRRVSLPALASELGLPADRPHEALSDALTTAQVFLALAAHLEVSAPETVGTLSHARRRLESLRAFDPV